MSWTGRLAIGLGMVASATVGAGVTLVVAHDDDPNSSAEDTAVVEPVHFQIADVPFTFEYPATFAPVGASKLPVGFVAILGIDPVNFIDVRRTATVELGDDEIVDHLGAALKVPGVEVRSRRTETVGGVKVFVFEVRDTSQGEPHDVRLHFFRAHGGTWELGCQMDGDGRDTIEPACEAMLATLEPTG